MERVKKAFIAFHTSSLSPHLYTNLPRELVLFMAHERQVQATYKHVKKYLIQKLLLRTALFEQIAQDRIAANKKCSAYSTACSCYFVSITTLGIVNQRTLAADTLSIQK